MLKSQRTFELPASHLAVLDEEASFMGLTPDQAMAQAIRLYQLVNHQARAQRQLAFVDANGELVREAAKGLPALD